MKNIQLEEIIKNCGNKPNKELANTLLTLKADFENIKKVILELTDTLEELEVTYDAVYNELQKRLKFKDEG